MLRPSSRRRSTSRSDDARQAKVIVSELRASRVASQRLGGARATPNAGAPGDRFPEGWQARWGQRSGVGCWYLVRAGRTFPQRPLCSRRPRRPASPARAVLAAVGSTWRQSRCARSPRDHGVRVPHLTRVKLITAPHRGGHPRDHVKHSAGVLLVVGEPPGPVDGLGDVWYTATSSRAIGPPSASRCPAHRSGAGVGRRAAGRLSTTSAVQATQGCVGSSWP